MSDVEKPSVAGSQQKDQSSKNKKREFIDFFGRQNPFAATAFVPNAHNELVKNLQNKFKATTAVDATLRKDPAGTADAPKEEEAEK